MADPIGPAEISQYLSMRSDFALEMATCQALREHGISPRYGGVYNDPITKKFRQSDVRATKVFGGAYAISFAVECKAIGEDYPLAVCRIPRTAAESGHEAIRIWRQPEIGMISAESRKALGMTLYRQGEQVGKVLAQIGVDVRSKVLTGNDAEVYDKWMQALASAEDLVKAAAAADLLRGQSAHYTFIMPVLLVSDGRLWVADYDQEGAKIGEPTQVNETTYFVDRTYQFPDPTYNQPIDHHVKHMYIFTLSGFNAFLSDLVKPNNQIFDKIFGQFIRREGL